MAPAPRLRDRHLHHRRRLRPPGQPRRRRHHHQRRHPVDDRRLRAAAHRGAAGVAGAAGRPVPRHPALGEPARATPSGTPRATRTSAPARSAWPPPPTPARWCGSSPARSAATPGPGSTYTPMAMVHATVEPGRAARPAVGRGRTTRWSTCSPGTAPSAPSGRPIRTGQLAVLGAGDFVTVAADGSQESRYADARRARARRPADPRAGRLGRPVRDEHQGRGAAGVRGLPEGPARHHPRPCTVRRRTCRRAEPRDVREGRRSTCPRPSRLLG